MDRNEVMRGVDAYITAWRDEDVSGVERIFTEDAQYRTSPYEKPKVGHEAIKDFWLADAGEVFTAVPEPFAVEGQQAVVRVQVRYGEPVQQEYRDLWLLTFADDGRVREFEEWAYWPGKPYTASEE